MSVVNPQIRFVYEDYKALPESMAKRYELLDGEILMVPAPTTTHQFLSRNVAYVLHGFVRQHALGTVLSSPIDVVFGEGDAREIVQPDVLYVSVKHADIILVEEIRGAPDLVVEVVSPGTETRDRTYKKHLYGRYGVREYWIVDPVTETVTVYQSSGAKFDDPTTYRADDTLNSPLFVGLDIELREVFKVR
ncbi:MAG: Uma2 family endonuclease [Gammaproteobacteria bacterium]|nr:Uma2 family endonuclease [Gammaproteobacteria bacterium]